MPEVAAERGVETLLQPAQIFTRTAPKLGELENNNLDAVGGFPEDALVVVCDGVNGRELSRRASQGVLDFLANPHVRKLLHVKNENAMKEVMQELFLMIARFIYIRSLGTGEDILTTAVFAKRWTDERGRLLVTTAHVGNSRAYLRRGNSLRLRTVDGTEMVNYLKQLPGWMHGIEEWMTQIDNITDPSELEHFLHEHGLTETQAADFLEGSSQITACLGFHPDRNNDMQMPAVSTFEANPGDEVWLTTDGGHQNVLFSEAREIACGSDPLEARVSKYFDVAQEHMRKPEGRPVLGGSDDISVGVLVV